MHEDNKISSEILQENSLGAKDAAQLLISFAGAANPELGRFMMQVAKLSRQVGKSFNLDVSQLDQIEIAAMVHDIGLLGLPKELQNKDLSLMTEEQCRLYSEHPVTASITLEGVSSLAEAGEIVLFHHEYMSGKGFPNGLSGDQIPLGSRILLAASDYCRIISTWPRKMQRLISHARRRLGTEDFKRLSYSDDPESIIDASAERLLIRDDEGRYDAEVVRALIRIVHHQKNIDPSDMVALDDLKVGMVLMADVHLDGGRLLVTKGKKLLDASIQTLQSLGMRGLIPPKLFVAIPE